MNTVTHTRRNENIMKPKNSALTFSWLSRFIEMYLCALPIKSSIRTLTFTDFILFSCKYNRILYMFKFMYHINK